VDVQIYIFLRSQSSFLAKKGLVAGDFFSVADVCFAVFVL